MAQGTCWGFSQDVLVAARRGRKGVRQDGAFPLSPLSLKRLSEVPPGPSHGPDFTFTHSLALSNVGKVAFYAGSSVSCCYQERKRRTDTGVGARQPLLQSTLKDMKWASVIRFPLL